MLWGGGELLYFVVIRNNKRGSHVALVLREACATPRERRVRFNGNGDVGCPSEPEPFLDVGLAFFAVDDGDRPFVDSWPVMYEYESAPGEARFGRRWLREVEVEVAGKKSRLIRVCSTLLLYAPGKRTVWLGNARCVQDG